MISSSSPPPFGPLFGSQASFAEPLAISCPRRSTVSTVTVKLHSMTQHLESILHRPRELHPTERGVEDISDAFAGDADSMMMSGRVGLVTRGFEAMADW